MGRPVELAVRKDVWKWKSQFLKCPLPQEEARNAGHLTMDQQNP